ALPTHRPSGVQAFDNRTFSRTIAGWLPLENRFFRSLRGQPSSSHRSRRAPGAKSIVEVNQIRETITALQSRVDALRGYL
ncbi:MAG: hypothetical protein R3202_12095, partial [Candidatus Competibacterales bacterium]|nr:hypothetical protein [Candidatus Competibacterales bacterium]